MLKKKKKNKSKVRRYIAEFPCGAILREGIKGLDCPLGEIIMVGILKDSSKRDRVKAHDRETDS